ncbi:hypothetical protein [Acidomonas methanolica]|uniref:Uncharacterized protein n=1 Tax=Acidomonas methanolica NBRC 104435 TaxID=1231351 RepID=A0A023D9E5_ACIMT|nr:hypothetical protein [Acidomonas methanolica]MBU2652906.1 hypothetical protein [Acidomonas methanolica]GAJ30431.1 hypothetical protein Amme_136_009 [Acidomonas methanolica NBRC 104435]GBQ53368.1 hypothetical protein AA0498_1929 [Acidomonas methanolica]GEK98442.1 hypothetical protein AME01nite_09410 [Acidomonas methanolica NBRC 104435]
MLPATKPDPFEKGCFLISDCPDPLSHLLKNITFGVRNVPEVYPRARVMRQIKQQQACSGLIFRVRPNPSRVTALPGPAARVS